MSRSKSSTRIKSAQYYPKSDLGITSFAGPRGGIQLMWKNHRYVCDSKKKNHRVYTCSNKRQGCRARIYVNSIKGSPKYGYCWVKNEHHDCEAGMVASPPPLDLPRRKNTRSTNRKKMNRTPSPPISNPSIPLNRRINDDDTYMEDEDEDYDGPVPKFEPSQDLTMSADYELQEPTRHFGMTVEGVHPPKVEAFGMTIRLFLSFPIQTMPLPHPDDMEVILSKPPYSLSLRNTTTIRGQQTIFNNRQILYVIATSEGQKIGFRRSNLEIGVVLPFEDYPGIMDAVTVHVCFMVQNRRYRICKPNCLVISGNGNRTSSTVDPDDDSRLKKRRRIDRDSPQTVYPHQDFNINVIPQHFETNESSSTSSSSEEEEEEEEDHNQHLHQHQHQHSLFYMNNAPIPRIHELPRQPPPEMFSQNMNVHRGDLSVPPISKFNPSILFPPPPLPPPQQIQQNRNFPPPPLPPPRRIPNNNNGLMVQRPPPLIVPSRNNNNNNNNNQQQQQVQQLQQQILKRLRRRNPRRRRNEGVVAPGERREIVVVHPAEGSVAGNEYVEIFFNYGVRNLRFVGEHVKFFFDGMSAPILNIQNARFYGSNLARSDEYKYRYATEDARYVAVVKTPPRDREGFVDIEMRGFGGELIYRLQNGYQYVDLYGRKKEKQNRKATEKVGRTDEEGWSEFLGKGSLLGGPGEDGNHFWEDSEDSVGFLTQEQSIPDIDEILDWGGWMNRMCESAYLVMMINNFMINYCRNQLTKEINEELHDLDFKNLSNDSHL